MRGARVREESSFSWDSEVAAGLVLGEPLKVQKGLGSVKTMPPMNRCHLKQEIGRHFCYV